MTGIMRMSLALTVAATAALAHSGVENPAVKARMDGMAAIGAAMKEIGQMAKGASPFDPAAARAAARTIAREAERTPMLFEVEADDPVSEALPAIWQEFDDFARKAESLAEVAGAAEAVSTRADLKLARAEIGAACKACHAEYRQ